MPASVKKRPSVRQLEKILRAALRTRGIHHPYCCLKTDSPKCACYASGVEKQHEALDTLARMARGK